jgi:hypothetical protein
MIKLDAKDAELISKKAEFIDALAERFDRERPQRPSEVVREEPRRQRPRQRYCAGCRRYKTPSEFPASEGNCMKCRRRLAGL